MARNTICAALSQFGGYFCLTKQLNEDFYLLRECGRWQALLCTRCDLSLTALEEHEDMQKLYATHVVMWYT